MILQPLCSAGSLAAVAGEPYGGSTEPTPLASAPQLQIDNLFPRAEPLQLLRVAKCASPTSKAASG